MWTLKSIETEAQYRRSVLLQEAQQAQTLKQLGPKPSAHHPRRIAMKYLLTLLVPALVLALSACGSAPIPANFTGTWNDSAKNQYGVVRSRYVLSQNGNQVSGDAYWSRDTQLLRVGSVSGVVAPDGTAELLTTLNDSDLVGKAQLVGSFKGVGFEGIMRIYKEDGTLNQTASVKLTRAQQSTSLASEVYGPDLQGW